MTSFHELSSLRSLTHDIRRIQLAQGRIHLHALVNTAVHLWVAQKVGSLLIRSKELIRTV
jgi:hypothetical protein